MKEHNNKVIIRAIMMFMLVGCLSILLNQLQIYAATFSYKDLKLDYNVKRYLYSSGKNGYKFIFITSKKGATIKYKKARVEYDDIAGHDVFDSYGKTYTAKLTQKSKYYIPIAWNEMVQLQPYKYGYDTDTLKSMKILRNVPQKVAFNYMSLFYAKIKRKKISTMISPAIFAI